MTPPKRQSHTKGFTAEQKEELAEIIDAAVRRAVAPAIRAELKDAGLRLDGDLNQVAATADFMFLRRIRLMFESTASKVGGAFIMVAVGGVLSLLAYGMKGFFSK